MNIHDTLKLVEHALGTGTENFLPLPKGIDLQDAERVLTQVAELCGIRASYLLQRGAGGCGDNGHDHALYHANRDRKRLRKALGYTYP